MLHVKFLRVSLSLILIDASVAVSLPSICFLRMQLSKLSVRFHFYLLLRGRAELF